MSVQSLYDQWSSQYDDEKNATRDVEGYAFRETLENVPFQSVLELGAGTGKNTMWLAMRADRVLAADLSTEMLAKATAKFADLPPRKAEVAFMQADITEKWAFGQAQFDLVSFSLVLEHIENLWPIFSEAALALRPGGYLYLGELHPEKQRLGSKARFTDADGEHVLQCHTHTQGDFTRAAEEHGFELVNMNDYCGWVEENGPPRILVMLFRLRLSTV